MITHVAMVPQPPLLVPGIGTAPVGLRAACRTAARTLARASGYWLAVGGHDERITLSGASGSFAGYGLDIRVSLTAEDPPQVPEMPLPALVAGWLRAETDAVDVQVELFDEVPLTASSEERACLLVLGDGSNRHGPKSPGSEDDRAPAFDEEIRKALASADVAVLRRLDRGLCDELGVGGRVPWQVLADLSEGADWRADLLYSDAPYGVGYHVAVWERVGS
ncbi:hypothetical protein [Amycolatopsis sp. CA-230715]|uniref:hypothetical protein n=1 Tax=Amycolatopsis sp. CA-230715 TaxID=2745196 RepID=UPI0020B456B1|nr:hypothetical protein [Amycolatopsis sp. CA-230715]